MFLGTVRGVKGDWDKDDLGCNVFGGDVAIDVVTHNYPCINFREG